jgi:hypothetical protein
MRAHRGARHTQLGVNGLQGGIPGFARGRPSLRDQAGDAGQDASTPTIISSLALPLDVANQTTLTTNAAARLAR